MTSRIIAALAFLVSVSPCAFADSLVGPVGGRGGGQFTTRCAPNEFLIGFEVRLADDVDAIRPVCSLLEHATAVSAQPSSTPVRWLGGAGGSLERIICSGDTPVVKGLDIFAEGRDTVVVNSIWVYCGPASAGTLSASPSISVEGPLNGRQPFLTGGASPDAGVLACAVGEVGVGIYGRSGIWLDSLGLICDVPRFTGPAVKAVGRRAINPTPPATVTSVGRVAGPTVTRVGRVPSPPTATGTTVTTARAADAAAARERAAGRGRGRGAVIPPPEDGGRGVVPPAAVPPPVNANIAQGLEVYGLEARSNQVVWARQPGSAPGAPGAWTAPRGVGEVPAEYVALLPAASGSFYARTNNGDLFWVRHTGAASGPGAWSAPVKMEGDWNKYDHLAPASEGVLYAITGSGAVDWYRNDGVTIGTSEWRGPVRVADGWANVKHVFSGGEGVIYTVTTDGRLVWRRHDGRSAASRAWSGPFDVVSGWEDFVRVFSPGGGEIYAVQPSGNMSGFGTRRTPRAARKPTLMGHLR